MGVACLTRPGPSLHCAAGEPRPAPGALADFWRKDMTGNQEST